MEARYHRIIDGMLEGLQLIGYDWRYLFVNEVVARHGQRSREELLGRTMMEAYPGIDQTPLFDVLRQCMDRRTPRHLENEFTYPDGSSRWFDLSIQPSPEGLLILSTDITERKEAELRVLRQVGHLRALRNIDIAIADSHDVNGTLEVVVKETVEKLNTDAACVLVHRAHAPTLVVGAFEGFHTMAMQRQEVRLGEGLAGRCASERQILHVPDIGVESDTFTRGDAVEGEGFVTWIGAPLVAKGEVRGVLEVYHRSPLNPDAEWLRFFETLAGQAAIAIDSALAFEELHRTNIELHLAYEATIEGWSRAMDLRDRETEGHTLRVTEMTLQVGRAAGMTESELTQVRRGALLHDIGKLAVPDRILHKTGTLTEDEWVIMRQHPVYAYDMLFPITYLRDALDIPYCHHERWDGTGYPRGLRGEEIPRAARLFAVVDVWDALRSDRPYRAAWPEEKVLEYLANGAGSHLDPEAVELFLRVVRGGVPEPHPVIGTRW
jgi:PAS domain S-box-containing protein